jgi:hypothetical protein
MLTSKLTPGADVLAVLRALARERLHLAAQVYQQQLQQALGVSNPPPYRTPSAPGEPPRKRTGRLQQAITLVVDQEAGAIHVGLAGADYGVFLERGTRRLAARPWMQVTLDRLYPSLKSRVESGS